MRTASLWLALLVALPCAAGGKKIAHDLNVNQQNGGAAVSVQFAGEASDVSLILNSSVIWGSGIWRSSVVWGSSVIWGFSAIWSSSVVWADALSRSILGEK